MPPGGLAQAELSTGGSGPCAALLPGEDLALSAISPNPLSLDHLLSLRSLLFNLLLLPVNPPISGSCWPAWGRPCSAISSTRWPDVARGTCWRRSCCRGCCYMYSSSSLLSCAVSTWSEWSPDLMTAVSGCDSSWATALPTCTFNSLSRLLTPATLIPVTFLKDLGLDLEVEESEPRPWLAAPPGAVETIPKAAPRTRSPCPRSSGAADAVFPAFVLTYYLMLLCLARPINAGSFAM